MKNKNFVPTFEFTGHKGMSADELAADLMALDALNVEPWSAEAEKLRSQAKGKIEAGIKEIFYIRLLPADEMSDYICALPYTLVESIFESALNDEDGVIDLLTEAVEILKKNMNLCDNAKKAMRKLLKVCQVLGCVGYFNFGEWEAFKNNESQSKQETQQTEKKSSLQCNNKIQKLKQELNEDASLLDDLITVSSSESLENIIGKYWKRFNNVIPEMFTDFICQKTNKPYSEKTIKEVIKRTKPITKFKHKPKK